jgi:hypothetical protein
MLANQGSLKLTRNRNFSLTRLLSCGDKLHVPTVLLRRTRRQLNRSCKRAEFNCRHIFTCHPWNIILNPRMYLFCSASLPIHAFLRFQRPQSGRISICRSLLSICCRINLLESEILRGIEEVFSSELLLTYFAFSAFGSLEADNNTRKIQLGSISVPARSYCGVVAVFLVTGD